MDCEVCLKFQEEIQRESEKETRAIMQQWLRLSGDSRASDESDGDADLTSKIYQSRKRRMEIARSLDAHRDEEHSPALSEPVCA